MRTENGKPGVNADAMRHARAAVREGDAICSQLAPVGGRESVGSLLARNAARFGERAAFCVRTAERFEPVSWNRFLGDAVAFGRALAAAGVRRGDRVAIVSPNRGEMLVVEAATMCIGAIYVPIFAGYPVDQTRALLAHARPRVLVVPDEERLARVGLPQTASAVVTFEPISAATSRTIAESGARHTTIAEALEHFAVAGADDPDRATFLSSAARVHPDAPCLIMYTSGTSGPLKGVVLTHDNILSQQRALSAVRTVTPDDRFLSYLPWHHSFGGIFEKYTALYNGATIFIDDSLGKHFDVLLRNWREVQPTVYFSVPKVYQQLVAHAQTHPEDAERIFHPAIRFVFTAAAPLPANLSQFFAARGIPVLEGWGLTETAPCCTLTDLTEARTIPGMVGYPIPGVTLRIAADGEVLVKGPNVMLGYFDNPRATEAALPGDGWFHTGDLGEFAGAGLKLVARKDRVFKMLNAEKVVPTEIENRLAGMNSYIRHVIVTGEGRSFLAALIFPDFFRIAEEFGDDRVTAEQAVKQSLRETILAFNRDHAVKYEQIEAFAVVSRELSIENHELTPSLKVRVRDVLREAGAYVEAVYEPRADCDCRFLRKVMRMTADGRECFAGSDRTIDLCHECGSFVFGDPSFLTGTMEAER